MEAIQEVILKKLPEMSKNQKKLANFILENVETAPLLSVNELAEKADVSSATVVRFTRVLGFDGYLEFRNHMMELLKEKLSPVEKYKATIAKKSEYEDSLNKVAHQVVKNINHSLQFNSLDDFKHIVQHILDAETIYCVGLGISHHMAEILAYMLKLYIKKAYAIPNDSISFKEQIILLNPKDLVIAFSFPPYSRATVEAAELAHNLGIPVISFTDKRTAPIAEFSAHTLIAKTDNILFTNSLGAISVLMNALVTEIALKQEDKVLHGLQKLDNVINDPRYFY
ncbi:MAG: MurR/RpiR family transcriptional regulator [Calditrichia bacterium]